MNKFCGGRRGRKIKTKTRTIVCRVGKGPAQGTKRSAFQEESQTTCFTTRGWQLVAVNICNRLARFCAYKIQIFKRTLGSTKHQISSFFLIPGLFFSFSFPSSPQDFSNGISVEWEVPPTNTLQNSESNKRVELPGDESDGAYKKRTIGISYIPQKISVHKIYDVKRREERKGKTPSVV